VTRAVARTHEHAQPGAGSSQAEVLLNLERIARADLERKLAVATTALHEAEQRHQAAITAAEQRLAERQAQYEIGMAKATANWEMVDEQLRAAALEVERARQQQAAAAAAVDRLAQREAELTSQLADASAAQRALERQLADSETAVEAARSRIERERLAAAEELAEQRREFQVLFEQEHERHCSIQSSLAQAVSALEHAQTQHAEAIANAETRHVEAIANAEKEHAEAIANAEMQARQLEANVRLTRLEVESKVADIARLTERENELSLALAELTASRADVERRLAATEAAFDDATTRAMRDRLAVSKRAADREAELDGQVQQERAARASLEQAIADAEVARRETQQRHETALAQAASDLAERRAQFEQELSYATSDRNGLAQRLNETENTVTQLRRDRESLATIVEQLTAREADLNSRLATVQAARDGLDHQLADATRAIEQGLARQSELDGQLLRERQARAVLEQAVADAEVARREAQQRHDDALAAARDELAERQARFDAELSATAVERDRRGHRLAETEIALDHLRREHQSSTADVERLTQRETELSCLLAGLEAARDSLGLQLAQAISTIANANAALHDAEQRHDGERSMAAAELAEHRAESDRALSQLTADRDRLSERLSETAQRSSDAENALEQLRREHACATATIESLTERQAYVGSQLADVQAACDTLEQQLAEATDTITKTEAALRDARQRHDTELSMAAAELAQHRIEFDRVLSETAADRDQLAQRVSETKSTLEQRERDHDAANARIQSLTQREAELIAQLTELDAARETLTTELADARAAALDSERSLRAEADALRTRGLEQAAQFEVVLAQEQLEHESRLADMQECAHTLGVERDGLQQSLTIAQGQSQQLQHTLTATAARLDAATRRAETLQKEADQLPRLLAQLDEVRAENNRLFEHAGLAMFRCTSVGTLIHANRACATLVGRRVLEQPAAHFASAVFEAPDALLWLIERCLSTRAKESIETTWRRNEGGRLHVRLLARLLPSDTIEVVVEDLTRLRVLEERLDQAHRMEAVGRFASEVAVTCTNLLNDIHQNSQQWLAAGDHAEFRQQGELVIDEVRRAADLLQQLATFGDEQARTPMLVDLNTLIGDLEPVLKRLAGDQVDVQIGHSPSPLNVEAQIERVERLLVNLASYGRERMPSGGRLRVDVRTEVVDRHFTARHRNVRLGLHALITVTGTRAPARTDKGPHARDDASTRSQGRTAARPGVNVGTLQRLVSECGGHLWMKIEPDGDLVAKIRLPLSSSPDQTLPRRGAEARVVRSSGLRHAVR
jgi:chromosome segregation ATPase